MKSCNEFQESILNGNITEEIMIHLENCDECKKIYDLINKSNNELAFVLPAAVIDKEIKKAFVSANKKIKFRDFISLILFIITAITLLSLALIIYNGIIFKYVIFGSVFMPFSLPIIVLFRKRKVLI